MWKWNFVVVVWGSFVVVFLTIAVFLKVWHALGSIGPYLFRTLNHTARQNFSFQYSSNSTETSKKAQFGANRSFIPLQNPTMSLSLSLSRRESRFQAGNSIWLTLYDCFIFMELIFRFTFFPPLEKEKLASMYGCDISFLFWKSSLKQKKKMELIKIQGNWPWWNLQVPFESHLSLGNAVVSHHST